MTAEITFLTEPNLISLHAGTIGTQKVFITAVVTDAKGPVWGPLDVEKYQAILSELLEAGDEAAGEYQEASKRVMDKYLDARLKAKLEEALERQAPK